MTRESTIVAKETPIEPSAETPLSKRRRVQMKLDELAREADPSKVSEVGQRKLFEEWERSAKTIQQAQQMLNDAHVYRAQCVEKIVKKLGRGQWIFKDQVLTVDAIGETVFLKSSKKKPKG